MLAALKTFLSSLRQSLRDKTITKLVVTQEVGRYKAPVYHLSKRKKPWVALCGEDTLITGISATKFPIKSEGMSCKKCAKLGLGGA